MDALRAFILTYPNWAEHNVKPMQRGAEDLSQISIDWFQSAKDLSQLALQLTGSAPVRSGAGGVRQTYINGAARVTRQANFTLLLLQPSGTVNQRADTSEFLFDFTAWLDEQDHLRKVPVFGDDPQSETMWASNGSFLGEWDDKTLKASLYQVLLHKIYCTDYEPFFE